MPIFIRRTYKILYVIVLLIFLLFDFIPILLLFVSFALNCHLVFIVNVFFFAWPEWVLVVVAIAVRVFVPIILLGTLPPSNWLAFPFLVDWLSFLLTRWRFLVLIFLKIWGLIKFFYKSFLFWVFWLCWNLNVVKWLIQIIWIFTPICFTRRQLSVIVD